MKAEFVQGNKRQDFATGRLVYRELQRGRFVLGIEPHGGGVSLELTFRQSEALQLLAALREQYATDEAGGVEEDGDRWEAREGTADDPLWLGGYDDQAEG